MELVLEMSLMFKEVQLKLPMLVPYSFFSKKNIRKLDLWISLGIATMSQVSNFTTVIYWMPQGEGM